MPLVALLSSQSWPRTRACSSRKFFCLVWAVFFPSLRRMGRCGLTWVSVLSISRLGGRQQLSYGFSCLAIKNYMIYHITSPQELPSWLSSWRKSKPPGGHVTPWWLKVSQKIQVNETVYTSLKPREMRFAINNQRAWNQQRHATRKAGKTLCFDYVYS